MCINTLSYIGDKNTDVMASINEMVERMKRLEEGVIPSEIKDKFDLDTYFFDIIINYSGDNEVNIQFESKWSPPLEEIKAWAKFYAGDWYLDWSEINSDDVGRLHIDKEGNAKEVRLKDEHFNAITEDDEGNYTYNGEVYESQETIHIEILDKLFLTQ